MSSGYIRCNAVVFTDCQLQDCRLAHWPETAFEEVPLNQCPQAVRVFAPSEGHSPVSGTAQKPLMGPVVIRAPRLEPSLLVELIRIVDRKSTRLNSSHLVISYAV